MAKGQIPKTCVFCAVAAGELNTRVVYEDDASIGFLDHRPLFAGHTLLIPRKHFETLNDLPAEITGPFFLGVRKLAAAVEAGLEAHGTFVALNNRVSQSVPHLHVHIVPRRFKDGLKGFFWPRTRISEEKMEEVQKKIAAACRGTDKRS